MQGFCSFLTIIFELLHVAHLNTRNTDYSRCTIHGHAIKYHHRDKMVLRRVSWMHQNRVWCYCAADRPSGSGWDWFDVHAVSLPQGERCPSPPCFPCPNTSSPLHQNQQSENQSVTQEDARTQIHTPAPRKTERGGRKENDRKGREGMTVEVKGWQRKEGQWLPKDSWGMIAGVGKKFTWKER